jgi:hypothetical protein
VAQAFGDRLGAAVSFATTRRTVQQPDPLAFIGQMSRGDRRVPPNTLEAKGVGVVLEAEHLCMSLRGAEVTGARTVTSALEGIVRDDPRTREEFPGLTLRRSG